MPWQCGYSIGTDKFDQHRFLKKTINYVSNNAIFMQMYEDEALARSNGFPVVGIKEFLVRRTLFLLILPDRTAVPSSVLPLVSTECI